MNQLVEVVREVEESEEKLAEECRQCREKLRACDEAHRKEVEKLISKQRQVGQWHARCVVPRVHCIF